MKDDHLTKPNIELENLRAQTIIGMAHWAGTGPKGRTCGDCEHHVEVHVGMGISFRCDKYRRMMQKVRYQTHSKKHTGMQAFRADATHRQAVMEISCFARAADENCRQILA